MSLPLFYISLTVAVNWSGMAAALAGSSQTLPAGLLQAAVIANSRNKYNKAE